MPQILNVTLTIALGGKTEKLSDWTLAIAFVVPIVALVIIVCIGVAVWRRRTFAYDYSYQQVNHDLDDEEIEFKNMIEGKSKFSSGKNGGKQGESVIDENDEELNFSTSDMGRLDMLEKYRDKLVSGVNAELDSDEAARI